MSRGFSHGWRKRTDRRVCTIFAFVKGGVVGKLRGWVAHALFGHHLLHKTLLLFFFSSWEALTFALLFVQHFAKVSLGFLVEFGQ